MAAVVSALLEDPGAPGNRRPAVIHDGVSASSLAWYGAAVAKSGAGPAHAMPMAEVAKAGKAGLVTDASVKTVGSVGGSGRSHKGRAGNRKKPFLLKRRDLVHG